MNTSTTARCMTCFQVGRCLPTCRDWATTVIVYPIDPSTQVLQAVQIVAEDPAPGRAWLWVGRACLLAGVPLVVFAVTALTLLHA